MGKGADPMQDSSTKKPAEEPLFELAPPDYIDPVTEVYKKDVDRTLLRENLKLTVTERVRRAEQFHRDIALLREAGRQARGEGPTKKT
jgi:hypothetical protein